MLSRAYSFPHHTRLRRRWCQSIQIRVWAQSVLLPVRRWVERFNPSIRIRCRTIWRERWEMACFQLRRLRFGRERTMRFLRPERTDRQLVHSIRHHCCRHQVRRTVSQLLPRTRACRVILTSADLRMATVPILATRQDRPIQIAVLSMVVSWAIRTDRTMVLRTNDCSRTPGCEARTFTGLADKT